MTDIIKKEVSHARFGAGLVTEQSDARITVRFKDGGDRRFIYPSAFLDYLTLKDAALQGAVAQEADREREAARLERQAREEEQEQLREARKIAQLAEKRATKKPAAKKAPAKKSKTEK